MKLFGFYITRTDWETLYNFERKETVKQRSQMCNLITANRGLWDEIHKLEAQLKKAKYVTEEGGKVHDTITGRFTSKKKLVHDQMRADKAYKEAQALAEPQPSDNCTIGRYDDIKGAK
jgi:ATP phosphoribosyltransferase regulatory subunit HisZ